MATEALIENISGIPERYFKTGSAAEAISLVRVRAEEILAKSLFREFPRNDLYLEILEHARRYKARKLKREAAKKAKLH